MGRNKVWIQERRALIHSFAVEDPSDDFVRIRDFVDCSNCAALDAFAPQELHKGYSAAMVTECNKKFKICRRQSRRVYEILRMRAVEKGNKQQLHAFKEDVKSRLSRPFLVSDSFIFVLH